MSENQPKAIARAVELLREALKSDHIMPYVESRIYAAIIVLGHDPAPAKREDTQRDA
jgi:hypothetical protein